MFVIKSQKSFSVLVIIVCTSEHTTDILLNIFLTSRLHYIDIVIQGVS